MQYDDEVCFGQKHKGGVNMRMRFVFSILILATIAWVPAVHATDWTQAVAWKTIPAQTQTEVLIKKVRRGDIAAVNAAITAGVNVNVKSIVGYDALYIAASNNHLKVVKLLLAHGANINTKFRMFGFTPLHEASVQGHAEVVMFLLAHGAHVNAEDMDGRTPLYWATYGGHADVVKLLLAQGAQIYDKNSMLQAASAGGILWLVKDMLTKGADINATGRGGKSLLARASYGKTPLSNAAFNGHTEVVKLLLTNGASIYDKNSMLRDASAGGILWLVQDMLDQGAGVNAMDMNWDTPIYWAADNGHIKTIRLLLAKGADVNLADINGWTPLSNAAHNGHIEVVKLLLAKGANVNAADLYRHTPIYWAAGSGHTEIVKLLLSHEADVNIKDKDGRTPLSEAISKGHFEVVKLLSPKPRR